MPRKVKDDAETRRLKAKLKKDTASLKKSKGQLRTAKRGVRKQETKMKKYDQGVRSKLKKETAAAKRTAKKEITAAERRVKNSEAAKKRQTTSRLAKERRPGYGPKQPRKAGKTAAPKPGTTKARRNTAAQKGAKAGKATRAAITKTKRAVGRGAANVRKAARKATQPARVLVKKGLLSKGGRIAAGRIAAPIAAGVTGYEVGTALGGGKLGKKIGTKLAKGIDTKTKRKQLEIENKTARRIAEYRKKNKAKSSTSAKTTPKSKKPTYSKKAGTGFGVDLASGAAKLRKQKEMKAALKKRAKTKQRTKVRKAGGRLAYAVKNAGKK